MRSLFFNSDKRWSNSVFFNMQNLGYYSGEGAITTHGPGTSTGLFKELGNDYDFSYEPMGYSDGISKEHDYIQETTIIQPQGWLEDTRTLASDLLVLYKAKIGLEKGFSKSREDHDRLVKMELHFSNLIVYKYWKIQQLKLDDRDPSKAESQLKIIFTDWKPQTKEQKAAKRYLKRTGGAADESKRGTVKEIAKKKPS